MPRPISLGQSSRRALDTRRTTLASKASSPISRCFLLHHLVAMAQYAGPKPILKAFSAHEYWPNGCRFASVVIVGSRHAFRWLAFSASRRPPASYRSRLYACRAISIWAGEMASAVAISMKPGAHGFTSASAAAATATRRWALV